MVRRKEVPMRDPARIPVMLETLKRIWETHPDLRLAQLVMIAADPDHSFPAVFYVEDDKLLAGLRDLEKSTPV